jgi:hypothetical protein
MNGVAFAPVKAATLEVKMTRPKPRSAILAAYGFRFAVINDERRTYAKAGQLIGRPSVNLPSAFEFLQINVFEILTEGTFSSSFATLSVVAQTGLTGRPALAKRTLEGS